MSTNIDLGRPVQGDVVDLILDDHRRFETLLRDLRDSSQDRDAVRKAFAALHVAHAEAEEKYVYPKLRKERAIEEHPAVALLDIDLPDGSGLDILNAIKEQQPETVVIMITGNVNVPNVLTALRGGAHDFISKPIHLEELRITLRNALETRELRREVKLARRERTEAFGFEQILGESAPMKKASPASATSRSGPCPRG